IAARQTARLQVGRAHDQRRRDIARAQVALERVAGAQERREEGREHEEHDDGHAEQAGRVPEQALGYVAAKRGAALRGWSGGCVTHAYWIRGSMRVYDRSTSRLTRTNIRATKRTPPWMIG